MRSCRFIQSSGCSTMLSHLSAPLILPSISLGILSSSRRNTCNLEKRGHYLYCNFAIPASSLIQEYPHLDSKNVKYSNISSSDSGSSWLLNSMSVMRIPYPKGFRNFLNHQTNCSFSTIQSGSNSGLVYAELFPNGTAARLKISRVNRADAQHALFEYLHGTRGMHFTDAEHISKNSPKFLQMLLAKIDDEHDVGRSLARFLRYHPINEFEPFFESLGLKPSELSPLLPRDLMYLSDDQVLLENYHTLCNYGVPRSKIGKMYKEGNEMFRYSCGILYSKLQAYEKLGLSKPTVIKLVSCCPTLLVGDINVEFLHVLEKLRSIGIELDWIRGCLSDKSTYRWDRIFKMLNFLDGMGCNKNELAALVKNNPRFIFDDSGKKIYILVALLLKLGLRMNNILVLFQQYPQILVGNFTKNLLQSVQFMVVIGMEIDDISRILSSHIQVLGSSSCKSPDVILKSLNISAKRLCEIIKEDPTQFLTLATRKKDSPLILPKIEGIFLQEKTNFLLKVGFVENTDEMAKALRIFRGRGDQLQERFDCLVHAGLDFHTASEMIKLVPTILNQSADVIEKKIDYLLNHLGYPLQALVVFPAFLCYNMEKIKLRFSMFFWLKEQGIVIATKNRKMVNSNVALSTVLACSDERFLKYFVNLHPKGPDQWEKLKNSVSLC
ncbi:transcription termination factor MTEF18, mitochondrial [Canna indica]|uniref:Transcription termination factor MTEF18, mitochondrial n=1 Tax=Canna indica TaxID=4628 RepID=A0AAQ3L9A1_9LILI|nr:transcription termination factor MTEF18, mitochondrial [Canna indica]